VSEAIEPTHFIHLRVHSAYSLLEGALPVATIAKLAEKDGMAAVGIADSGNLFGALEFSEKLASSGIQPIVGCAIAVDFEEAAAGDAPGFTGKSGPGKPQHRALVFIAKDAQGYANLMRLSSAAFLDCGDVEKPHVKLGLVAEACGGLIVLTGGPDGPIDSLIRDGQGALARERLGRLEALFGDRLYVELQRHGLPHEQAAEGELVELAYQLDLPLVATNEPYFAAPSDYEAHDALICIAEGRYVAEDNRRRLSREHYFKTQAEMVRLFADLPEAILSTVEIARRCSYRPMTRKPILPQFVRAIAGDDKAAQDAAEAAELKRQAEQGLKARLDGYTPPPGVVIGDYAKRLAFELEIISRMKFPGYFLIVADFIKWAKTQGIPVGPGRGSGAGSLVAYALTITDLDPLRFGLLFERFLNPERVSMPDFDIDFCQDRRDEVIRYVQDKYGADRVAQIITFGKLQARAVLRDVGRVLQMPYGQVDKLCKLIPNNPANPVTLAQAIEGEPKLQEARDGEPVVAQLLQTAQKLEGLYRHASTHAAGVVIADRPLVELVPLYRDPRAPLPATQYNMKWVEPAGLVKFDFLGLKTLTVIQKAVKLIARRGVSLDMGRLPLDDKKSYELMARGETAGVFQLESTGMRESLRRLKPDRFEDIIAMVSLYRPGPMDNIPTYINRKHGEEPVDYLHPLLQPVLQETYGVIIYQEQVQQIAQALAGYSLGEADLLRRAMGKKIKAEMAQQRSRFVEGAKAKGVKPADAEYIFDLVDKFAGYGFNKSHAAAYALVSYQTAYLKANYPVEFLAATMTLDAGNTDKLAVFAQEARRMRITVLPPCINRSEVDFGAERLAAGGEESLAVRYSLAALKNIGTPPVEHIVAERREKGPYKDIADFARRINPKLVNKRPLETLAQAGAFDSLEPSRAAVFANVDNIMALASRISSNAAAGQNDLFGTAGAPQPLDLRPVRSWTAMDRLQREFDAVGFFLSGHPLDEYREVLEKLGISTWREFEARAERGVSAGVLAGIVTAYKERRSQKGNKFAFATFSDATGQFEAVLFSDTLAAAAELLDSGQPLLLRVEAERDGDTMKVRVQSVEALDRAATGVQRGLRLVLDRKAVEAARDWLAELRNHLIAGGRGEIRLVLALDEPARELEFMLPGRFDLSPSRVSEIRTVPGVVGVHAI